MLPHKLLRKLLRKNGIETYITAIAKSGSVYISFKEKRMGKVRVGDHNERERYGYKWQLREDIREPYETTDKGHKQFFFPTTMIPKAVERMIQYYNTIRRNDGHRISLKSNQ